MIKLTKEDFALAISYMGTLPEISPEYGYDIPRALPYGTFPGQATNGGIVDLASKDQWDNYIWNPPEFDTQHSDSQENVASKPTWEQLVGYAIEAHRVLAIKKLRQVCKDKITLDAFEEESIEDERNVRLDALENNKDISYNLEKMEELKEKYRKWKAWINTLTDLDYISSLDFTEPSFWK